MTLSENLKQHLQQGLNQSLKQNLLAPAFSQHIVNSPASTPPPAKHSVSTDLRR